MGRSLTLDLVPYLFFAWGMTLLLRKSSAQARIEGWDPRIWGDDDYAVVDDTKVCRIYRELILGKPRWLWSLSRSPRQVREADSAAQPGVADTLDEAKAAFAKR
jgi:hypothetical protein